RLIVALLIFFTLVGLMGLAAYIAVPSLIARAVGTLEHLQEVVEGPLQSIVGSGKIEILGQTTSASEIASGAVARLRTLLQSGKWLTVLTAGTFGGVFGIFLTL